MNDKMVSFIIMSYNSEEYIIDAINGAVNQDYANMEIIISDDCSTDGTYKLAQDYVNGYKGEKRIRLLQNEYNLGIAGHLNKLWWNEAKGDWIIPSAGDDISESHRVSCMINAVSDDVCLIVGNHSSIDSRGNKVERFNRFEELVAQWHTSSLEELLSQGYFVPGCCMAIERRFLEFFGPFENELVAEDKVLAYRAFIYGRAVFLKEELVRYRIHKKSISYDFANYTKFETYYNRRKHFGNKSLWESALIRQTEIDLRKAGCTVPKSALAKRRCRNVIDTFVFRGGKFYMSFLISVYFYESVFKEALAFLRFKLNE